jgi:hypothetical protein
MLHADGILKSHKDEVECGKRQIETEIEGLSRGNSLISILTSSGNSRAGIDSCFLSNRTSK